MISPQPELEPPAIAPVGIRLEEVSIERLSRLPWFRGRRAVPYRQESTDAGRLTLSP